MTTGIEVTKEEVFAAAGCDPRVSWCEERGDHTINFTGRWWGLPLPENCRLYIMVRDNVSWKKTNIYVMVSIPNECDSCVAYGRNMADPGIMIVLEQ